MNLRAPSQHRDKHHHRFERIVPLPPTTKPPPPPAEGRGTASLLILDVVTRILIAADSAAVRSGVHARKRLNGANAEIRPDGGSRLVVTTPTAYRSI